MLISLIYPLVDFRLIAADRQAIMPKPKWPLPPQPDSYFQRHMGAIKIRPKGGLPGRGESVFCDLKHSISSPDFRQIHAFRHFAFKRFYFDGCITASTSIGISTQPQLAKSISSFPQLSKITAQLMELSFESRALKRTTDAHRLGELMADLYHLGSSQRSNPARNRSLIVAGQPFCIVQINNRMKLDQSREGASRLDLVGPDGAEIAIPPPHLQPEIPTALIFRDGYRNDYLARTTRMGLARLFVRLHSLEALINFCSSKELARADEQGKAMICDHLNLIAAELTGRHRTRFSSSDQLYCQLSEFFSKAYRPGAVDDALLHLRQIGARTNLLSAVRRSAIVPTPTSSQDTERNFFAKLRWADSEPASYFISYRRLDSAGHSGRLFDRLQQELDSKLLFFDVETLQPGGDFREEIFKTIERCDAVLAVIGPNWLSAVDKTGKRRIDDESDLVRQELATALSMGKVVIPILVGGTSMPIESELPEQLRALARRTAFAVRHEAYSADLSRLLAVLRGVACAAEPGD